MDGAIIAWNASAELLFGYQAGEIIGKSIFQLVPPVRHAAEAALLERIKAGERIRHFDTMLVTKEGSLIDVSLSITPIEDAQGNVVGVSKIVRDIAERKRIDVTFHRYAERLQVLSRRLMAMEVEGRRRLSRELHDQIGSNLTGVAFGVQALRARLAPAVSATVTSMLDNMDVLLSDTIGQIRLVLEELRPPALDELGLLAALRHYARRLIRPNHLIIDIVGSEPSPRLSQDVEISFFRIAQEALTNVAKHAAASRVVISLKPRQDGIVLEVQDNGKGIKPDAKFDSVSSLGMTTMRERAEAIGAVFTLTSIPGAGTQIAVDLALRAVDDVEISQE